MKPVHHKIHILCEFRPAGGEEHGAEAQEAGQDNPVPEAEAELLGGADGRVYEGAKGAGKDCKDINLKNLPNPTTLFSQYIYIA